MHVIDLMISQKGRAGMIEEEEMEEASLRD